MDRDGMEKMECPKGWPYIANMANTSVSNSGTRFRHPAASVYMYVCAVMCRAFSKWWLFQS